MDDLYPRDGDSFFIPPVPQDVKDAELEANKKKNDSIPFIEDTIEWFDQQILEASKIDNIDLESKLPAEVQIKANQEVVRLLTLKRGELESLKFEKKR